MRPSLRLRPLIIPLCPSFQAPRQKAKKRPFGAWSHADGKRDRVTRLLLCFHRTVAVNLYKEMVFLSTVQDMINISGKEAKKHVNEALKIVFPGIKFRFSTSYDSINVSWTDGPLVQDVERVLNRFVSYTYVYSVTDHYRVTGYEWKGEVFVGPQYLYTSRIL